MYVQLNWQNSKEPELIEENRMNAGEKVFITMLNGKKNVGCGFKQFNGLFYFLNTKINLYRATVFFFS